MAEEHVFDQYTKAKASAKWAEEKAQELVIQFFGAGNRLTNWKWKTVGFRWHNEEGNPCEQLPMDGNTTICIADVPSLLDIQKAAAQWRESDNIVRNIEGALTDEQRATLKLPPR